MNSIAISILTMGLLGAFFAYGLSIAKKKFKVEEDPRIDRIEDVLPGANCGGCGYPGCRAFAEAVAATKADVDGCPVGGMDTAKQVADIMGMEVGDSEREVAVLICRGTEEAALRKAEYRGIHSCYGANLVQKGNKKCSYGCMGYGDCVSVCNFDAIRIGPEGIPVVDREKCTGCGLCVKACPKNILELHPLSRRFFVLCKSFDGPKASRQNCKNACIGCKICIKGVKNGEITVDNDLSVIHNTEVVNDEEAMQWIGKCPTKVIGNFFVEEPKQ